ncbi:MAG: ATP-dependent Clp protease ATP-binding subunit [Planctomycetes bacterium]|nr:ATP-dependent Clp protease ATP-binding subunit [Planctomycetota bacterium]
MPSRNETQVVLKYCEVIDEFIKIRVFADDDLGALLRLQEVTNRRGYQRSVVERCVLDYQEAVLPLFRKFNRIYKPEALEDVLYQICVEVNPHLEIHQVSLPLDGAAEAQADDVAMLRRQLAAKVLGIERDLMARVIGQRKAIQAVAKAVKKAAVGLKDPRKPIGVFLMVGSTGSGKTELAKVVAERVFDRIGNLVRVDCSEFALPHEYAKLIGAPPGYIGHNEGGFLTEAVRTKRSCVVLFDEVEKAHHKIHNLLLQLMDEGTLTDGKGNVVRFDSTLVLLTSNLGVKEIEAVRNRCGFGSAKREGRITKGEQIEAIQAAMKSTFRPEFLNRLDDVLVFNTLTEKDCERIARLQLNEVRSYLGNVGVDLKFSPRVEVHVAAAGYSEEYGARELRRIIKAQVENPLAELLLSGRYGQGDALQISVRRGRLHFVGARTRRPRRPRSAETPVTSENESG